MTLIWTNCLKSSLGKTLSTAAYVWCYVSSVKTPFKENTSSVANSVFKACNLHKGSFGRSNVDIFIIIIQIPKSKKNQNIFHWIYFNAILKLQGEFVQFFRGRATSSIITSLYCTVYLTPMTLNHFVIHWKKSQTKIFWYLWTIIKV